MKPQIKKFDGMRVTLYMAMTINGYIARDDGSAPWSDVVWNSYYATAKEFPSMILGRKTYEIMRDANEFEKIGNPFTVVLTSIERPNEDNAAFVKTPGEAPTLLREKGFDTVLIGGGAMANTAFLEEGLIDEIILDVEPMMFGKGIPLFALNDSEARLELAGVKKLSDDVIQIRYTFKR